MYSSVLLQAFHTLKVARASKECYRDANNKRGHERDAKAKSVNTSLITLHTLLPSNSTLPFILEEL